VRIPRPKPKIDFTVDALDYKNVNLLKQFVTDSGFYMIAISSYDNDPLNSGGLEIWADQPYNVERAPDGPGAPQRQRAGEVEMVMRVAEPHERREENARCDRRFEPDDRRASEGHRSTVTNLYPDALLGLHTSA
jgi:hypothetical protein